MPQTADFQTILFSCERKVAEIRLNRPHRLNAVITPLYREVLAALDQVEENNQIATVVITGEGRAFSVGADLKEHATGARTDAETLEYIRLGTEVCKRIYTFPKIIIAVVNGFALGAGAEIACSSDFILMKDTASIGFPEISIGTYVGGAVTVLLPRLVGLAKARELLIKGHRAGAEEALSIGLATRVFPDDRFDADVQEFAEDIASRAPISMRFVKQHLNDGDQDYASRLEEEMSVLRRCMRTEDWQEGVNAFAEKRSPVFKGI